MNHTRAIETRLLLVLIIGVIIMGLQGQRSTPWANPVWLPDGLPLARNGTTIVYQTEAADTYRAVIGAAADTYQDADGQWRTIDPNFVHDGDGYVVSQNSLRSSAGQDRAWLTTGVAGSALIWRAEQWGTLTDGTFLPLAQALDTADATHDGPQLTYSNGWSQDGLREMLVSSAGTLEHLLIVDAPPAVSGHPTTMALQAMLTLPAGGLLAANGAVQHGAFSTDGALTVLNGAGQPALILDPIVAFEQARPTQRVGGRYEVMPGDTPGTWRVTLATPADWWLDPARRYPVALDPTMHVNGASGYGQGMGWIGDKPNTPDEPYRFDGIILGTYYGYSGWGNGWPSLDNAVFKPYPGWNSQAEGYVQFNALPGLLQNSPAKIKHAYIDIEAAPFHMPYYKQSPDWEEKALNWGVTLSYVGACPAQCGGVNGFSLQDNRLAQGGFNWDNRPLGAPLAVKPDQAIKVDALKNFRNNKVGKYYTTSWEITQELTAWYSGFYTEPGQPGPVFRLALTNACPGGGPYYRSFNYDQQAYAAKCGAIVIAPGQVRLRIEYETLPLSIGANMLNLPGVAGFAEGLFEETAHQHALGIYAGSARWRAVAVRGNHAIDHAAPATRHSLMITDAADPETPYATVSPTAADETVFALIDDHSATTVGAADLQAYVLPSNENELGNDPNRNYRIEYVKATPQTMPSGAPGNWSPIYISSDRLIDVQEFPLNTGDNLTIKIDAPPELAFYLVNPSGATVKQDAVFGTPNNFNPPLDPKVGDTTLFSLGYAATDGRWALVAVNQVRPKVDPLDPVGPETYTINVSYLRCPAGSIGTARWNCQPLRLPVPGSGQTFFPETVGSLTVYNVGNFDYTANGPGNGWCTQGEGAGAPIIGPVQNNRYIYVAQGSLCYDIEQGRIYTTEDSAIGLAAPLDSSPLSDKRGFFAMHVFGSTAYYPLPSGAPHGTVDVGADGLIVPADANTRIGVTPFSSFWKDEYSLGAVVIDASEMQAAGAGTLMATIVIAADAAPLDRTYTAVWTLYPKQDSEFDKPAVAYHFPTQLDQAAALPSAIDFASLQLRILNQSDQINARMTSLDAALSSTQPLALLLRAPYARISQPATLGGASLTVQAIVNAPGRPLQPITLKTGEKSCNQGTVRRSCLDIRRAEYAWAANGSSEDSVLSWELPDIHLADQARTVAFATDGALSVWSSDHPLSAPNLSQAFSFDTWDAKVAVNQEKCGPADSAETTVIRGNSYIALPNIGDDGSKGAPQIEVAFKLCATSLRSALLTFETTKPGIAVASTGFGVSLIGGSIDVGQVSTQAQINLDFQSLDGSTLINGHGALTIDTAGLFELEANGEFLQGVLDANMLMSVAWQPFDMTFSGTATCCADLVEGSIAFHAWVGQGWQGKYHWLPDNKQLHFTGQIQAKLQIKTGWVVDDWPVVIPPFTVGQSAQVSFGEFCNNNSCSATTWGASATTKVVGFSVGVYIDSGGASLILGSNGHKLIDQHGGARQVGGVPAAPAGVPNPYQVIQPGAQQIYLQPPINSPAASWPIANATTPGTCSGAGSATVTCGFSVSAGTGRALFMAQWQNGALGVELINPLGIVINQANAVANGAVYSSTVGSQASSVSYAVVNPAGGLVTPGNWTLRLTGVGSTTNYRLTYMAEKPAPTVTWQFPMTAISPDAAGDVALGWTALRGGAPIENTAELELFVAPLAEHEENPDIMAGITISNGVRAADGGYLWHVADSGLAAGQYAVGLRLNDSSNANGTILSWAPGSINYQDTIAPPIPVVLGNLTVNDGVLVVWNRDDTTVDLAGYLIEYTIPDWNPSAPQLLQTRRVMKSDRLQWPLAETARLGGLNNGSSTTVCIRAFDASDNVSDCTPAQIRVADTPVVRVAPPELLEAIPTSPTDAFLFWQPPPGDAADRYLLTYAPTGCAVPLLDRSTESPASPVVYDGAIMQDLLTGLTPGQTYRLELRAFKFGGNLSLPTTTQVTLLDTFDGNGNDLPDMWEDVWQTFVADEDRDGDGLTAYAELGLGTSPLLADSDGDGHYDPAEVEAGTDPCDPESAPPYYPLPKLALAGLSAMTFGAATNVGIAESPQIISVWNEGAGNLNWQAVADQPWLVVNTTRRANNGSVVVSVDALNMRPGIYQGNVTISSVPRAPSALANEAVTIPVTLHVADVQTAVPSAVTTIATATARRALPMTVVASLLAILFVVSWIAHIERSKRC